MRNRRIARRIASSYVPENPCTDAGSHQTLATKVFYLLLQSFLLCAGRSQGLTAGRPTPDRQGLHQWSPTGVWLSSQTLSTRHFASMATPVPTPFNTSTLVTKGCRNEAVS